MGKYLKMTYVFGDVVAQKIIGDAHEIMSNIYGHICVVNTKERADIIAHAINSHDELVAEVERLRGIINRVISTSKELSLRSPSTQWGDRYKECALATAHALEDMLK